MQRHLGFTTFTVTLLLTVMLLSISLLVGKLMVSDRRVSLNEVQYRQALALAELGLSDGVGRLAQDASWRSASSGVSVTVSAGTYTLFALDDTAVTVGGASVTPVRVRAQATLVDSTANADVEIKTIKVSVLAGTPAAPLTVAGGMAVSGNFTVVANPNGGGPGVPLSIWTNGNVDLTNGSGQTCHQGDYSGGCSAYISQKGDKQSDIKDNDTAFPSDLVWYLFNENDDATGWANLESRAVQMLTNCDSLSTASRGWGLQAGRFDRFGCRTCGTYRAQRGSDGQRQRHPLWAGVRLLLHTRHDYQRYQPEGGRHRQWRCGCQLPTGQDRQRDLRRQVRPSGAEQYREWSRISDH